MARRKSQLEEMAPNVGVPVGKFVEEFVVKPVLDGDGVQVSSAIGKDGLEYPDSCPMSVPVNGELPIPLLDMMRMLIKGEVAPDNDFDITESEEEANDFEVNDEFDLSDVPTEYEKVFEPKPEVKVALEVAAPAAAAPAPVAPAAPVEDKK